MKKNLVFLALMTNLISSQTHTKSFILGINDFLFKVDKTKVTVDDKLAAFASLIHPRSQTGQLFDSLRTMEKDTYKGTLVYDGQKVPQVMHDHLIGKKTHEETMIKITEGLAQQPMSDAQKKWLLQKSLFAIDPTTNAHMMKPIDEGCSLIKRLKDKGHDVYIIENWDSQSLQKLKEKFGPIFASVKKIIISSEAKKIKSVELLEAFFQDNPDAHPNETIAIETEPAYLKFYKDYNDKHQTNMQILLCEEKDFDKLSRELGQYLRGK